MVKREFVFNATRMKERRKWLRKKPTEFEEMLWKELKNKRLGFKFKRQYSLGNFVVDFFCKEQKVAVELEGEIHQRKDVKKYDDYRFKYFQALGVKTVRVKNEQVTESLGEVLDTIRLNLTPSPSPDSGEGNGRGEVKIEVEMK